MARLPKIDPVDYLVRRLYPNAEAPHPMATASRAEYRRPSKSEQKEIDAYRKSLEALPPEMLDELFQKSRAESAAAYMRPTVGSGEMDEIFAHWARMDAWTLDEATSLSLGLDPSNTEVKSRPATAESESDAGYSRRRKLIHRAMESGNLALNTPPAEFVYWAQKRSIELPPGLVECIRRFSIKFTPLSPTIEAVQIARRKFEFENSIRHSQVQSLISQTGDLGSLKSDIEELLSSVAKRDLEISRLRAELASRSRTKTELTTRERSTVLKLIIGMAKNGYGYDHTSLRSATASEIAGDIHKLGLSIDEDTVRKWLKEATELLDGGQAE